MIDARSILSAISSDVSCKESIVHESGEKVKWYPILKCDPAGLLLGVEQEGKWVVEAKSCLYILSEAGSFWRLVSLLEQPLNDIRSEVAEVFNKSLDVSTNIDDIFPFTDIVRSGLEFGTKHWAEKAFEWYDELLPEKKQHLRDSLTKLETAKWASQKLRQKAKKELKRMDF
ncbi:hypothetical protein [Sporomusa malonica]|uniref:Uncharacterized protein n=1 Tax=Sporomusa malonica TaxID=112901 RepID=A0A1W2F3E0_9FIRM|nr:hypothetical protein [Sporomusa malonica]SMD16450.1 hypothetical protein SAMN04488500_1432 [Sporomusa malonica]